MHDLSFISNCVVQTFRCSADIAVIGLAVMVSDTIPFSSMFKLLFFFFSKDVIELQGQFYSFDLTSGSSIIFAGSIKLFDVEFLFILSFISF